VEGPVPSLRGDRLLGFRSGQGAGCIPQGLAQRLGGTASLENADCLTPVYPESTLLRLELAQPKVGDETRLTATLATSEQVQLERSLPDAGANAFPPGRVLIDQAVKNTQQAEDVVARIPRYFPNFRPNPTIERGADERAYTLLLIPDWQLVRALQTLEKDTGGVADEAQSPKKETLESTAVPGQALDGKRVSSPASSSGTADGVGYVLEHLELLHVQYVGASAGAAVPDLMSPLRGVGASLPGEFPGVWASRAPVLLVEPSDGLQVSAAQRNAVYRSEQVPLQVLSLVLLLAVLWVGIPRLAELWQEPPTERAAYWPGTVPFSRALEDGEASKRRGDGRSSERPGGGTG
jgi:hypothetical protein